LDFVLNTTLSFLSLAEEHIWNYSPNLEARILTILETLQIIICYLGLPKHKIPSVVDALIETIHLTKYADRPCGKYSGGNRRKLSLALALIG